MRILHWLMPWRREQRPDKPFQPVGEVRETVSRSHALQGQAQRTITTAFNSMERQHLSGIRGRLQKQADDLRALTNAALDRTQGK